MKPSTWLDAARAEDPAIEACSTREGSGWNDQATGVVCGTCRGFGY
jgi:DnaJ-class molecular chaperone